MDVFLKKLFYFLQSKLRYNVFFINIECRRLRIIFKYIEVH